MSIIQRYDSGKMPAYAWPGGYPMYYLMEDGDTLCPDCANGENGSLAYIVSEDADRAKYHDGWGIVGQDIHWEGEAFICCHCGKRIDSAYGEVD